MPNWLLKTAAHRAICWLPKRQYWNGLFQKVFTKSTTLSRPAFETKLSECRRHIDAFLSASNKSTGFQAVELGTGWYPALALSLYLCGAENVWTFDIDPLVTSERLDVLFRHFWECNESGDLKKLLPALWPERITKLITLSHEACQASPLEILAKLNIHIIVGDARHNNIPNASIDFFVSNGVLEYVPPFVLREILLDYRRMSRPGAVMSHRLNLVDVFSYFDKSITPFNYLRYTDPQWQWRNSPLIWQSRLRISDYRAMITGAGFQIVREESISGSAKELATVPLAPQFGKYSQQDLLILHSYILAKLK